MKRIEAIIRPDKVGGVFAALKKVGHPGLMVTEIKGYGYREGLPRQLRGSSYKVDHITRARVEITVNESDIDVIVDAIRGAAYAGRIGDGKIFIHPVDDAMRVCIGEKGVNAL
jgi:nitrogen regulatory protein P-II 1